METKKGYNDLLEFVEDLVISLENKEIKRFLGQTYGTLARERKYPFSKEQELRLLLFLNNFKSIISVENGKNEFVAVNHNHEICFVKWHAGKIDPRTLRDLTNKLISKKKVQNYYIKSIDSSLEILIPAEILTDDRKNELEEGQQEVLNVLKDHYLHSPALINDFGEIKYSELFDQLVNGPRTDLKRKWIGYFNGKIADSWVHGCLVAIRDYLRKHKDIYKY